MNGTIKVGLRDVPLLHDKVLCAHTACLSCTLAQMEQQLAALTLRVEALEQREEVSIEALEGAARGYKHLSQTLSAQTLRIEALEEREVEGLSSEEIGALI